jgi:hypothetical protein
MRLDEPSAKIWLVAGRMSIPTTDSLGCRPVIWIGVLMPCGWRLSNQMRLLVDVTA